MLVGLGSQKRADIENASSGAEQIDSRARGGKGVNYATHIRSISQQFIFNPRTHIVLCGNKRSAVLLWWWGRRA